MSGSVTPTTLRAAASLLEQYQSLGTPERLREIRRAEAELTIENHALRSELARKQEIIDRLNRRLDAVQAKVREKGWQP